MTRGTTPTHTFNLPFDTEKIAEIKITYAQNDEIVLTKKGAQCEMEENAVTVKLTQVETLLFDSEKAVQIQVRVLTKDGEALASSIKRVIVDNCLDDEVLE